MSSGHTRTLWVLWFMGATYKVSGTDMCCSYAYSGGLLWTTLGTFVATAVNIKRALCFRSFPSLSLSPSLFHSLTAVKVFAYKHPSSITVNCIFMILRFKRILYFYIFEWLRSRSADHVTLSRLRWLSSKCQVRIHQSFEISQATPDTHHTKGVFGEFFVAKIFT